MKDPEPPIFTGGQPVNKNNTSGVPGVSWNKSKNKWIARIGKGYKNISLGSFLIFEDAVTARKEAEIKYFGEFAPNHTFTGAV